MNVLDFKRKKEQREKISMLTCYDYPSARIIAQSSIDCVLIGDSVAMAVYGYDNTMMASMDMMELHTSAVARGLSKQFKITDLPFLCHRESYAKTLQHVKRLLQAGAQAIKIEGADLQVCQTIENLVTAGIPIIGHIGLTPQYIHQLGGFIVQGKQEEQAASIAQQAKNLESAGCFAIVLECVPKDLAKDITQSLTIPTIGIGAGPDTDGQVLVWHDVLGLQPSFKPRFVKHFISGEKFLLEGIDAYVKQVKDNHFPSSEYTY